MRALVVIPTYDEAATVGEAIAGVRRAAPACEVLVVDDASPDGTAAVVEGIAAAGPAGGPGAVHLLRRGGKDGLGAAYLAGFAWGLAGGYDAVVEMDADLSHDPTAVPALLDALGGADLVIGSRYVPGGSIPSWGLHRRALSALGNRYASWALGVPVRDMTSGFRAFRADLLRRLPLDGVRAGGYGFQVELAYRAAAAGARITEVPIRFVDRSAGESKMSPLIAGEALVLVSLWGARRLLPAGRGRPRSTAPPGGPSPPRAPAARSTRPVRPGRTPSRR